MEDVLIKVDEFVFSVDFVVLDMKHTSETTIRMLVILGCLFLATSNALINYRNGLMHISFCTMTVQVNIFLPKMSPSSLMIHALQHLSS